MPAPSCPMLIAQVSMWQTQYNSWYAQYLNVAGREGANEITLSVIDTIDPGFPGFPLTVQSAMLRIGQLTSLSPQPTLSMQLRGMYATAASDDSGYVSGPGGKCGGSIDIGTGASSGGGMLNHVTGSICRRRRKGRGCRRFVLGFA